MNTTEQLKELKEILRSAFEAGQEFENECNCNNCELCFAQEIGKKAPDFNDWFNLIQYNDKDREHFNGLD